MKKLIIFLVLFLLLLTLSIKGKTGNPVFYQEPVFRDTNIGGPFENSGSASRFALTEAIVENKSFTFTTEQAKFAAPDISAYNGKAFSLFAPGVSFIGVPFYMLGKLFGMPQIFTYYSVLLFTVLNVYLIFILARKLGAGFYTSLTAGFIYLFATNTFPYASSFTQHIMTTTFLLLSLILGFGKRTLGNNIFLGMAVGAALLMDVVNAVFLLPVLIYVFIKQFAVTNSVEKIKISFNPNIFAFIIGILPMLLIFGIYNQQLTGSPTRLAQFIGNAKISDSDKNSSQIKQNKYAEENVSKINLPFESRRLLNGMNVLVVSEERSWLFYSPVLLLGIAGIVLLYKRKETRSKATVITSVVVINVLSYAMFIDPWGGWAFGPRYLIPSASLMALGIAPLVDKFGKNLFFLPIFYSLTIYSIYVSTLGAFTTSTVPPKIEAERLTTPTAWGLEYNNDLLEVDHSSSLFYNLYLRHYMSSKNFVYLFTFLLSGVMSAMCVLMYFEKQKFAAK